MQQPVCVEGVARFGDAPLEVQPHLARGLFLMVQHGQRLLFTHAVECVQHTLQWHAVGLWRVGVQLEAVPVNVGFDAGLGKRQLQLAFADVAERADDVGPDIDSHGGACAERRRKTGVTRKRKQANDR